MASVEMIEIDPPPDFGAVSSQGAPPAYDSIYREDRVVEPLTCADFLESVMTVLLSMFGVPLTCVLFLLLVILLIALISMAVMGVMYKEQCKAEPMIITYLIVGGVIGAAKFIFSLILRCRKYHTLVRAPRQPKKEGGCLDWCVFVNLFLFAWFITGCVYIYRTKDDFQPYNKSEPSYCNFTLYWYAFWITTSVYILMGGACFINCAVDIENCVTSESDDNDDD